MNLFTRFWKWLLSLFWSKNISITIIGLPAAGKTTLVRALANQDTEEYIVPTIGASNSKVTIGRVNIDVHDMSGNKKSRPLWDEYCNRADVILYVIDSSDQEAVTASEIQLSEILHSESLLQKPILVIANKQDLPESLKSDDIMARMKLENIQDRVVKLFCISAKKKTNIDSIINWIVNEF
ncbi:small GTP-binding protein, putative [Trichomonas vaginalis G3]|uniref:Small GTP-binding protein, putative n=1 Tax=Trichomonas vaginalis (strain ATCC PRA-98 / G3) TaxID=412133 RepID=A2F556_TRIV3|nr:small GTPase superfamily, Arf family [Trichomonas vaginalis G3]EAX99949.1 small GTP-binding protein, putative [Trichomonas vaginalis G3]KAI5516708.1 small GTPase superfamily, Arf family [Trichomonas vaginalis G3]|eukprot:XP_001312879.1 small GTP-binding protein [Trichomonas vaginalis G3]